MCAALSSYSTSRFDSTPKKRKLQFLNILVLIHIEKYKTVLFCFPQTAAHSHRLPLRTAGRIVQPPCTRSLFLPNTYRRLMMWCRAHGWQHVHELSFHMVNQNMNACFWGQLFNGNKYLLAVCEFLRSFCSSSSCTAKSVLILQMVLCERHHLVFKSYFFINMY